MATQLESTVDFKDEPSALFNMRQEYNTIKDELSAQIQAIADKPLEVDASMITGKMNEYFDQYKARSVESAMQSVRKTSSDLDAYLGKSGGGARALIAAGVKGSMMQDAYKAIGSVYEKHSSDVITAELESAKVNISAAATKADTITSLMETGTKLFLGVSNLVESNYATRLNASIEWAKVDAQARGQELQAEMANLSTAQSLLGNKNYGIAGFLKYGMPTVEDPTIKTTPYDTYYKYTGNQGQLTRR